MKISILLLSERDFLTLPAIRSLGNQYRVFVAGPRTSTVRFSRFCARYFSYPQYIEANKDQVLIEYINMVGKQYAIDVVIPLDLGSTIWVASNRHQLLMPSFPLSDANVFSRLHNKWKLTALLETLSIPYPKTVLVKTEKELTGGILSYPFLIKPTDQDSGKGIVKIENESNLKRYLAAPSVYKSFPLILQQYIDGFDIDISLVAINGSIMAWTIQQWKEIGMLEFVNNQKIYDIGEKIIAQEKYSGFMNIDFRVDNQTQEIFVLESNPRAWGTMNASILAGVNFIESYIACATHKQSIGQENPVGKSYVTFRKFFVTLFTRPWLLRNASVISKRDFLNALTDPMPYLLLVWKMWEKG